jgi:hypothetical protein
MVMRGLVVVRLDSSVGGRAKSEKRKNKRRKRQRNDLCGMWSLSKIQRVLFGSVDGPLGVIEKCGVVVFLFVSWIKGNK